MWNEKEVHRRLDNHVTLTFDLTHDLDLVVSRSKSEIALFEEGGGGGLIDMERKGCELIIHDHGRDFWVTLVGWVDVPYSDWGDFRRRRVVDLSSFLSKSLLFLFKFHWSLLIWVQLIIIKHWFRQWLDTE